MRWRLALLFALPCLDVVSCWWGYQQHEFLPDADSWEASPPTPVDCFGSDCFGICVLIDGAPTCESCGVTGDAANPFQLDGSTSPCNTSGVAGLPSFECMGDQDCAHYASGPYCCFGEGGVDFPPMTGCSIACTVRTCNLDGGVCLIGSCQTVTIEGTQMPFGACR